MSTLASSKSTRTYLSPLISLHTGELDGDVGNVGTIERNGVGVLDEVGSTVRDGAGELDGIGIIKGTINSQKERFIGIFMVIFQLIR